MKKLINGRVNSSIPKHLKYLLLFNSPFLSLLLSLPPACKDLTENAKQSDNCISEGKAKVLEMLMSDCRVYIYNSPNFIIQICSQAERTVDRKW